MITWAARLLRLTLIALAGMLILLIFLSIPGQFRSNLQSRSGSDGSTWAAFLVWEVAALAVMAIVIGLWLLIGQVMRGATFTEKSVRYLTFVASGAAVVTVLLMGVLVVIGLQASDPAPIAVFTVATLIASTLTLITVVVRDVVRRQAAE